MSPDTQAVGSGLWALAICIGAFLQHFSCSLFFPCLFRRRLRQHCLCYFICRAEWRTHEKWDNSQTAMSASADQAQQLKGEAGAAFAKKQVREAELLYRRALGSLRSSQHPQPSEQQDEEELPQQQQRDADSVLLEATLVSNIAICRKLAGGIKQSLKLSEEVLTIIDACATEQSEQRKAMTKLRKKNALRVEQLTALHNGLVAMEQLRDGSADAATVAVADSCSVNRATLQVSHEYSSVGQELPKSLVEKIVIKKGARKVDDVSVFFGGCGDCRHVFATLFDLVKRVLGGKHPSKKGVKSVHLEVNDVHPFALARFAVVCSMSAEVHKLQKKQSARSGDRAKLKQFAMALQSFAMDCYIQKAQWNGIVKPVLARVRAAFEEHSSVAGSAAAANSTESNPLKDISLSWLTCDSKTAVAVVGAIDQWLAQVGILPATGMRNFVAQSAERSRVATRDEYCRQPGFRAQLLAGFQSRQQQHRAELQDTTRKMAERQVNTTLRDFVPPQQLKAVLRLPLKRRRQLLAEQMLEQYLPSDDPVRTMAELLTENSPKSLDDVDIVKFIFQRRTTFLHLKPAVLDVVFWYKHRCYPPVDVQLNPLVVKELKQDAERALSDFIGYVGVDREKRASGLRLPPFEFSNDRILVNPSVFDQSFIDQNPQATLTVAHLADPIAATVYVLFVQGGLFTVSPQVTDMADLAAQFFGEVGSSLALLSQEHGAGRSADSRPGFSVKLSCGDVFNALGAAGRADNVFDHIYLSNIPDYTGMLPVFSYGVEALKPHGIIESKILINTKLWNTSEDYLYHMGFCDFEEAKNYCQSQFVGDKNPFESMVWKKSPKNWWMGGGPLQNKAAFVDWLHDVLLNILLPSRETDPSKIVPSGKAMRPQSLASFFRLAMSWRHPLPRIWHAEVVRDVLKNGHLMTAWQQHPQKSNPVQLKERRKSENARSMGLAFALAETATLAAVFRSPVACLPPTSRQAAKWQMAPLSLGEICRVRAVKERTVEDNVRAGDAGFGVAIVKNMPATQVLFVDIRYALHHSEDQNIRMHPHADESTSDVEVLHLISTCHVDNAAGYVDFLLPRQEWETLSNDKSVSVMLFSYYNWLSASKPQPLGTRALSTNDLRLGGPVR